MSTPFVIPHNRMLRDASWLFDRDQEAADDAAAAAWDRRRSIERAVSRADLFDEATMTFTAVQDEEFMKALDRGSKEDLALIHCLLDQVKEAIVKRRLAGGV